jgi:hypothetical protein
MLRCRHANPRTVEDVPQGAESGLPTASPYQRLRVTVEDVPKMDRT